MKKKDFRWLAALFIIGGLILSIMQLKIGVVVALIGIVMLPITFLINDISVENSKLAAQGSNYVVKKFRNDVGSYYAILLLVIGGIGSLFKNSIIMFMWDIVTPVIAAIILCEVFLKPNVKYIDNNNYPKILRNTLILTILIGVIFGIFTSNLFSIIGYVIAVVLIVKFIKPKNR